MMHSPQFRDQLGMHLRRKFTHVLCCADAAASAPPLPPRHPTPPRRAAHVPNHLLLRLGRWLHTVSSPNSSNMLLVDTVPCSLGGAARPAGCPAALATAPMRPCIRCATRIGSSMAVRRAPGREPLATGRTRCSLAPTGARHAPRQQRPSISEPDASLAAGLPPPAPPPPPATCRWRRSSRSSRCAA